MSNVPRLELSRRQFLGGMGGLVVAISLPLAWNVGTARAAATSGPLGPLTVNPEEIDSWLHVGKDGIVTILTGKVELGTGTLTASRQVVAEELYVPFASTRAIQGITGQTVDQSYTAGSQTMITQWATGLRISAASARETLLAMAASRLRVPAAQLTIKDGVITAGKSHGSISYAKLLNGAAIPGAVYPDVTTKEPSAFTIVGTSVPREDIPDKIFGTFHYVQDVKISGMRHGRVVRPMRPSPLSTTATALAIPVKGTIANGTLGSVDASSVAGLPGNVKVVQVQNFVGVVADREEQAVTAAQALKVTWDDPANLPGQATLYQTLTSSPIANTKTLALTGDVDQAIAQGATKVSATYLYPYQLHGSIGPSCAVADVHDGIAEIWSGTQGVYQLRSAIATVLALAPENVRITYVEGSGCYGLNGADDVSVSAALMSQAAGRPVRVQYMRGDEMAWENFGTPMVISLRAGLDGAGRIAGWDFENWTENRGSRLPPPGNGPAGVLAGQPEPSPPPSPPSGTPPLGDDGSNAFPWYDFPSERVISNGVYQKWLFTGPLRSPSRIQNTFAQESFMDELAAAAKQDPVAFRLAHTNDPRLIAVIAKATSLAKWSTRPSPDPGQRGKVKSGRGFASVIYEGKSSWVAVVIHVTVDTATGAVTPTQVVVVQDCGTVVNPDGVKLQIEGNVIQGISRSLIEEVGFDRSGVTSVDWVAYPIVTFPQVPDDLKIALIDRTDQPALGVGEASISVIPAAFANAIFDATGARLRQIPFTPSRVKQALTS